MQLQNELPSTGIEPTTSQTHSSFYPTRPLEHHRNPDKIQLLPVDLTEGRQVVDESGRELEVEGEVAADEVGQAGVGGAGVEDRRLVLLVRRLVLAELDDHQGAIW